MSEHTSVTATPPRRASRTESKEEEDAEMRDPKYPVEEDPTASPQPVGHDTAGGSAEKAPESSDDNDDATQYPGPVKLAGITAGLALGVFLFGLDGTILATATPKITDEFHALADIGWYAAAYFMTSSTFQLVFGKMYTILVVKWVYLVALGLFELGSLVCATAPNSAALIVGRAIAGIGSAGLYSGSVIILSHSAPLAKRPLLTGILSASLALAAVIGPFVGGAFTDHVTWRWCFYINLPLGAVTLVLIGWLIHIPRDSRYRGLSPMALLALLDIPGLFVLSASIVCLLLALQWGGVQYPWNDGRIIALLVVCIVLLIGFVLVEVFMPKTRAVGPEIFKTRTTAFAAAYGGFMYGAFQVMIYYLPVWFQGVQQVSAFQSSIRNIPVILGFMVFAIVSGGLTNAIGYYTPFMILGSMLTAIGAGLLSTLTPDSSESAWIGYQVLFGFGIGSGLQQALLAVQTVLTQHDIPIGVTLVTLMQNLFGAIFVGIAQNVLQNQLSVNIRAIIPNFSANALLQAGATNIAQFVPHEKLSEVLGAYSKSLTQTYYVAVAIACISLVGALGTEWKSVKKEQAAAEATEEE